MIRAANAADAPAIAEIYRPYVVETTISFEVEPPDAADIARRLADSTAWLVCERAGEIVGYAYAGQFHPRPAYRWSSEISIYVAAGHHRAGVGRELLVAMLDALREAGQVNAFAGIALPNPGSVGLFESLGFEQAALYRAVGFKLGAWHDVGWWQLALREPPAAP